MQLPAYMYQAFYPGTCAHCGAEHTAVSMHWVDAPNGETDWEKSATWCYACFLQESLVAQPKVPDENP